MDSRLSYTLDLSKFFLIILVVFLHSTTRSDFWNLESLQGSMYIYKITRVIIGRFIGPTAIPMFFFLSGYLFFKNINTFNITIYLKKIKSRFSSLLIPYILWNIICGICIIIVIKLNEQNYLNIYGLVHKIGGWHIFWDSHKGLSPRPIDFPLWYIRDLIVITLLSPLSYFLNKVFKWYWIPIVWIASNSILKIPYTTGFSLNYFLLFSLGAFWAKFQLPLICKNKPFVLVCISSILFIILLFKIPNLPFAGYWYTLLAFMIGAIILKTTYHMYSTNIFLNQQIISSSFFIYASHTIFIREWGDKLLSTLLPYSCNNGWLLLLRFVSANFITIIICIILFALLKISIPSVLNVLCGRRK